MKKNSGNKFSYREPADYFPKEVRRKAKIGEYAESNKTAKKVKKPRGKQK